MEGARGIYSLRSTRSVLNRNRTGALRRPGQSAFESPAHFLRPKCVHQKNRSIPCKLQSAAPNANPETENSQHLWADYMTFEVDHAEDAASPQTIRHLIGLRTWRLNGMVGMEFEFLVSEVEGLWRQILEEDIRLGTLDRAAKLLDSIDLERKGETFSRQTEDPEPTDPGYPRMFSETREYASRVFRKLHVNLAVRQDGVELMHIMMVPYLEYDMPIFTLEMVGVDDTITYGMVDLIPASMSGKLPELYDSGMKWLQEGTIKSNREAPEWLKSIGSPNAIIMVPNDEDEAMRFLTYAGVLSKTYLRSSKDMQPVGPSQISDVKAAHERFYQVASPNSKSRDLLKMSFKDESFLDEYYGQILYDLTRNADEQGFSPFR
ncbi:hypothetical protein BSKO_05439 [Bryopsis sp. KO-2023]|nr:hypothetical protein BSKO_05439 [Bryopsis sp. KO-2023]